MLRVLTVAIVCSLQGRDAAARHLDEVFARKHVTNGADKAIVKSKLLDFMPRPDVEPRKAYTLGWSLKSSGRYEEALLQYQRARELYERRGGANTVEVATVINNVALVSGP